MVPLGLTIKRYSDAASQFLELLKTSPDFEPAHKFAGVALSAMHQEDEAAQHLKEALRLDPSDVEAKQQLAQLQSARK